VNGSNELSVRLTAFLESMKHIFDRFLLTASEQTKYPSTMPFGQDGADHDTTMLLLVTLATEPDGAHGTAMPTYTVTHKLGHTKTFDKGNACRIVIKTANIPWIYCDALRPSVKSLTAVPRHFDGSPIKSSAELIYATLRQYNTL